MDGSRGYTGKISVRMTVIRLAATYILYQESEGGNYM